MNRRAPMRKPEKNRWNNLADDLLNWAEHIWRLSSDLDTAVRDNVAEGLARIVNAAFDCRSIALELKDCEGINAYVNGGTAQWFRDRGFAEWFCCAAAAQFNASRPRTLEERKIKIRRIA